MENTKREIEVVRRVANIHMTADLGNGRAISVQYSVDADAEAGDINADVDKFLSVMNRQQAKSALVGHAETIEAEERKIKRMREDLEAIDERHARRRDANGKHSDRIPQQEVELRIASVKNIKRMEEELEVMKEYHKKLSIEAGVAQEG